MIITHYKIWEHSLNLPLEKRGFIMILRSNCWFWKRSVFFMSVWDPYGLMYCWFLPKSSIVINLLIHKMEPKHTLRNSKINHNSFNKHANTSHVNTFLFFFILGILVFVSIVYSLECICYDGLVSIRMDLVDIRAHWKLIRVRGRFHLIFMFARVCLAFVLAIDFLISSHLDRNYFLKYLFQKW